MPLDTVSAEIVFEDGQENYRNVKINDRPTDKPLQQIDGSWSTGEFASILLDLFHPATHAQFRPGGASPISGFNAQVYDFQVQSENSHWMLHAGSQNVSPAYAGSVWIDPNTARVLRIEMQARDLPSDFPMDQVETAVDYSYVRIGETSALLPVHAETLGCERGTSDCSHNIIDFRNYHEFKSESTILLRLISLGQACVHQSSIAACMWWTKTVLIRLATSPPSPPLVLMGIASRVTLRRAFPRPRPAMIPAPRRSPSDKAPLWEIPIHIPHLSRSY